LKNRIETNGINLDSDESAVLISYEDAMVFRYRKLKIFMVAGVVLWVSY
jgi:hypothetical protein